MLHEQLTSEILGICFDVAKELGSGFLESVYENALVLALREKGLDAQPQCPIRVAFRGHEVGKFFADILVDGKILLEVKAVKKLSPEHQAQVINYLKASEIDIGLLVNFGKPRLEYRRLHA